MKLTIGVDIDDTLVSLMERVVDVLNSEFNANHSIEEMKEWDMVGLPEIKRKRVYELFKDPIFFSTLRPIKGAQEFVREMDKRGHRIVVVSATASETMSARATSIRGMFPEIKESNIILTASKDLIKLDVLFDDKIENVQLTSATVPVLVSQPWNSKVINEVRANSPKEYIEIVDLIEKGYTKQDIYRLQNQVYKKEGPHIVAIAGGSGSGKTTVANALTKNNCFKKVMTSTTRKKRDSEEHGVDYNFYDEDEFDKLNLVAKTNYIGNEYGIEVRLLQEYLSSNQNCVIVLDEAGVREIKEMFGDAVISIFLNRNQNIITSILERNVSDEEKEKRIKQLFLENDIIHTNDNTEFKFAVKRFFDYSLVNVNIDNVVDEIYKICGI